MNQQKILLAAFYKAWEYLIDYPLPALPARLQSTAHPQDRMVLAFFPVTGFLLGLFPLILGTLGRWFFNPVAGALLFAVSAIVILIGKDSGRGVSLFCSAAMLRFSGLPAGECLKRMNGNPAVLLNEARFSSALVFLVFLIFADLFLMGIAGAMSALPAIFAGDALLQAQLAAEKGPEQTAPRLNCGTQGFPEIPGIIIALLLLIAHPQLGTLVMIAVFIFIRRRSRKYAEEEYGGISAEQITFRGFTATLILSVLALTLLTFR